MTQENDSSSPFPLEPTAGEPPNLSDDARRLAPPPIPNTNNDLQIQRISNSASKETIGVDAVTKEMDDEPETKRQKRTTSWVWMHFTKNKETVEVNGKQTVILWAQCNKYKYKARGESSNGTKVFWNHLKNKHNIVVGQQMLKVEKKDSVTTVEPYMYDQEASMRKFHLAIIMHEYPFSIVEHEYFIDFIKSLRPSFPMKSRVTVRKELMDIFTQEKEKLYESFKTMKKGRHAGAKLSDTFVASVVRWFIEKKPSVSGIRLRDMFSLTLDNAFANEVCVKESSPLQWEEFKKCVTERQLNRKKSVALDVATRWNSTYLMLMDALYYKNAFNRLLLVMERRRYQNITPPNEEWGEALSRCKRLKKFNDITELLSGTLYPTANIFYRKFCEIKLLLGEWRVSDDITIKTMVISMTAKSDKYWKKSNVALV